MRFVFVTLASLLLAGNALADGLLIAPVRVVLNEHQRSQELTLVNTGTVAATYRVSITNMRMNPDGTLAEVTEPEQGARWLNEYIRFSPRQVTLEPNVAQSVRIMLKSLPSKDSELRSALAFRQVPTDVETPGGEKQGVGIRVSIVYGLTTPVLFQPSSLSATAGVTCLLAGSCLECQLTREGTALLTGLTASQPTDLAVSLASIPDPSLSPAIEGVRLIPRSGKVAVLNVPLLMRGEVSGTVYVDGVARSGLDLELIGENKSISKVRNGYDGWYYFSRVTPGRYTLRVDPVQLDKLGLQQTKPVEVLIDATGSSLDGVNVTLEGIKGTKR